MNSGECVVKFFRIKRIERYVGTVRLCFVCWPLQLSYSFTTCLLPLLVALGYSLFPLKFVTLGKRAALDEAC